VLLNWAVGSQLQKWPTKRHLGMHLGRLNLLASLHLNTPCLVGLLVLPARYIANVAAKGCGRTPSAPCLSPSVYAELAQIKCAALHREGRELALFCQPRHVCLHLLALGSIAVAAVRHLRKGWWQQAWRPWQGRQAGGCAVVG